MRASYHGELLDITGAENVEIEVGEKVIWVSVDGLTVLRICQISDPVEIKDNRRSKNR
jgi:hypothetical protein